MQIELATCPACGASFHPLRSRAVMVIDGRVRAFCSIACRDRGLKPDEHTRSDTGAHSSERNPNRWPVVGTELRLFASAAVIALALVVILFAAAAHKTAARPMVAATTVAVEPTVAPPSVSTNDWASEVWIYPIAGPKRRGVPSRRFGPAREGIPAEECKAGRCAVDIPANPGDVVMAVHDGVIEEIVRAPAGDQGNEQGRFIRINHKGRTVVSSYLLLDGIREDLRPGIPVRVGSPIGTVAAGDAKRSDSHLRFAISVRSTEGPELFIDPAPMLILWPVRERATASLHAMQSPHR